MKLFKFTIRLIVPCVMVFSSVACENLLDEDPENTAFTNEIDSTGGDLITYLYGAYGEFYKRGWEDYPLISVRGDDVNAAGYGDQQDYGQTDLYKYNKDYWMYNSVWQNFYKDILTVNSTVEIIDQLKSNYSNKALADQYIAEAKTIRAFMLFQLSRLWGDIFIPTSSIPDLGADVVSKDEVMQFIATEMDEAAAILPNVRPNERTDIPGGVTKYTALAIKALADLELKNYQGVADATSQIIDSHKFTLEPDFYELFKIQGKLNDENILEWQYSDFGAGSGDASRYTFAFFGPQGWAPKVKGAASGWGFYEPSMKWIKFMLDRSETTRLETSVLFTDKGIDSIKASTGHETLPDWISNVTPSGDTIKDYARAIFSSGKHYLPSDQLIPGRTEYGSNKNLTCIRYAEVLLMHAEALTQGATSTVMTADEAVNEVRSRANMPALSGVTNAQVMDEKFAELAMEWGTRYYDMVRLRKFEELNYGGRTFNEDDIFLPYPQAQVDQLPALRSK